MSLATTASGRYSSEVLATDSIGHAAYCRFDVDAAPPFDGLWLEAIASSLAVRSPTVTLLHAGTGGDPLLKPSWMDPATACSMQVWQNPAQCVWDEPGVADDPIGVRLPIMGPVDTAYMNVPAPSTTHAYHVGFHAKPFTTAGELRGRLFCDGALVAEQTYPISAASEFLFLGTVTYREGGGCSFDPDGANWTRHPICMPGDSYCP